MVLIRYRHLPAVMGGLLMVALIAALPATPLSATTPLCRRCHSSPHANLGRCSDCHRGNERTIRKALAHHDLIPARLASFALADSPARERGSRLANLLACRRCHRLQQRGNGLASDLDRVAATIPVARLRQALQTPAWYMPDFRLAPADLDDLLTYLLFTGKDLRREKSRREVPQVIHFADDRTGGQDPFTRHCGGCHMTLSERHGGLGRGKVAPNLAGLLGEFYPRTAAAGKPWTRQALKEWLDNPRQSRPLATMPPRKLTETEFNELAAQLKPPSR